jgi:hypothetical protein
MYIYNIKCIPYKNIRHDESNDVDILDVHFFLLHSWSNFTSFDFLKILYALHFGKDGVFAMVALRYRHC